MSFTHSTSAHPLRRIAIFAAVLVMSMANIGTMWANYAYMDLSGFTDWYNGSAWFRLDKNGSGNVDSKTEIPGTGVWRFDIGDYTGDVTYKRMQPDTENQWNYANGSISSSQNVMRISDWNEGSMQTSFVINYIHGTNQVYFDNSVSNFPNNIYFVIGHDYSPNGSSSTYTIAYKMSPVTGTKLFHVEVTGTWQDANFYAIIADDAASISATDWGSSDIGSTDKGDKGYTAAYKTVYNMEGGSYLITTAAAGNGKDMTITYYSGYGSLPQANATQAAKKRDAGTSYSDVTGSWPATLKLKGSYMKNATDTARSTITSTASTDDAVYRTYGAIKTGTITQSYTSISSDYYFEGWGTGSTPSNTAATNEYQITAATTVYAFFSKKYTLTFLPKGTYGTSTVTASVTDYVSVSSGNKAPTGHSITVTATPATGYKLVDSQAWFSDAACSKSLGNGTNTTFTISSLNKDSGVYAKFEPITYSITYNLNSGTQQVSPAPATSYNITSSTITLPTPTRDNYTFAGWYDNSGFTGSAITTIASGSYGNKEYWAKWTETPYTVSTSVSGGGGTATSSVTDAKVVTASSNITATPTNVAWRFKNWVLDDANVSFADGYDANKAVIKVNATANSSVTAHFQPRYGLHGSLNEGGDPAGGMPGWAGDGADFTVEDFDAVGEGDGKGVDLECARTLEPNKEYKFRIQDREAGGRWGYSSASHVLPAEGDGHNIKLSTYGDVSGKDVLFYTVGYGTYTFKITNMYDNGDGKYYPAIEIVRQASSQLTLGVNNASGGSVSAVTNEGSGYTITNGQFFANGSNITFTASANTGYTFAGWYSDSSCETAYDGEDENVSISSNVMTLSGLNENTTVYAKFTPNTYTADNNLDKNSGDSHGKYTATFDATSIAINTTPAKTGYHVDGYYGESGLTNRVADSDGALKASVTVSEVVYTDSNGKWKKDGNVTLYTKWTANTYTITFDKNGGSEGGSAIVRYDSTTVRPASFTAPTYSGYAVTGYYTAASGGTRVLNADGSFAATNISGYVTSDKWTKASDCTLYAHWGITPTLDVLYRTNSDVSGWNDTNYPKLSSTSGATNFECKWGSRMFAIQQYEIPNFATAKTLTLTLSYGSGQTNPLGVWAFPYEMPTTNGYDADKRAAFFTNVATVTGKTINVATGTFSNMLGATSCVGNTWIFTINAGSIQPYAYKPDGTTAIVQLLITSNQPDAGNAGHYASNNSSNNINYRPKLSIAYYDGDTENPKAEFNYRTGSSGSAWTFVKDNATNNNFETNASAEIFAVEQFVIEDYSPANKYTLTLHKHNDVQTIAVWDFPHALPCSTSVPYTSWVNDVEDVTGVDLSEKSYSYSGQIQAVACSDNKWTFTIPGYALTPISLDNENTAVVNLLLTSSSKATYKTNHADNTTTKPTLVKSGSYPVWIKDGSVYYEDLNAAITAATAGDVIVVIADYEQTTAVTVNKAVTIRSADDEKFTITRGSSNSAVFMTISADATIQDLTIAGKDAEKTTGVRPIQLYNASADFAVTFDNVTFSKFGNNTDNNGVVEVADHVDATFKDVTFSGCTVESGSGDFAVKGGARTTTIAGTLDAPEGAYLQKNKRITNSGASYTSVVPLHLASDYKHNYSVVLTIANVETFNRFTIANTGWYSKFVTPGDKKELAAMHGTRLTFDKNGGDADGSAEARKDSTTLVNITHATRTGYTLTGYFTADEDGDKIVNAGGTLPDEEVEDYIDAEGKWIYDKNVALTLYAQWTANVYTVEEHNDGGRIWGDSIENYTYGEGATLPTCVTKWGCDFDGWYDNNGLTGSPVTAIGTSETGNKDYYARWTEIAQEYSIADYPEFLAAQEGDIIAVTVTGVHNCAAIYLYDLNSTEITHFDLSATGTYTIQLSAAAATGIRTYGLQVTGNNFTFSDVDIRYRKTLWTGTLSDNKGWAELAVDKSIFSGLSGGDFLGLNISAINNGESWHQYAMRADYDAVLSGSCTATGIGIHKLSAADVVALRDSTRIDIVAQYLDISNLYSYTHTRVYTVTLNTNGGTINAGDVTNYTFGTGATLPTNVTKTGYTFAGWYDNSGLTGSAVTTITTSDYGNKEYWAKWTANDYTVTLNTNSGTINSGNVTSYTYGVGATLPTDVTKMGYKFDGWFDNSGLAGDAVTEIADDATGDKEYWAKWTEIARTISSDTDRPLKAASEGDILVINVTTVGESAAIIVKNYAGAANLFTKEISATGKYAFQLSSSDASALHTGLTITGTNYTYTYQLLYRKSLWSGTLVSPVEKVVWQTANLTQSDLAGIADGDYVGFTVSALETDSSWHQYNLCAYKDPTTDIAANNATSTTGTFVETIKSGEAANLLDEDKSVFIAAQNLTLTNFYRYLNYKEYPITYYDADTTEISTLLPNTYTFGEGAILPTVVTTKAGYAFDGWLKVGDSKRTKRTKIDNTSYGHYYFIATWKQTLTLDMRGVISNLAPTVMYDSTSIVGYNPGATFPSGVLLGYYTDATDGTKVLNADGTFAAANVTDYIVGGRWRKAGATTLYAHWDATVNLPTTVDKSNVVAYSSDMTWHGDDDEYFDYGPSSGANTGRWAEWQVNVIPCEYTIKEVFDVPADPNGHEWLLELWNNSGDTVTYNTTRVWTAGGERTEATKWDLSELAAGVYTLRVTNAFPYARPKLKSITLAAQTYTISYAAGDYGSGSLAGGTKIKCQDYTLSDADDAFTRAGYAYDGWSTNEDGSTKNYNLGATYSTDEDLTLYPHWICATPPDPTGFTAGTITDGGVTFTITDDADAASYDIYYTTSSTAPTGSTDATTTSTSKTKAVTGLSAGTTYYAWVRAVCDEDHKSDWVALTGSTFFTNYSVTMGTVTTNQPEGSTVGGTISASPTSAAEDATVTLTATPTSGYGFVSWKIEKTSDNSDITSDVLEGNTLTMPAYGVTVKATFAKQYSIAYKEADGSTTIDLTPTSYLYGIGVPSLPTPPAKTGYTFANWYNSWCVNTKHSGTWDDECITTSIGTSDHGSATYLAKYTPNEYTITLNNQSATSAGTESISVTYDDDANLTDEPAITVPTKTCYAFGGYYTETAGGGSQIIDADGNVNASVDGYTDGSKNWIHAGDVTLYAKWTQVNLAKSKTAYSGWSRTDASTGQNDGEVPSKAVDGNLDSHHIQWAIGDVAGNFETRGWWAVNLGDNYVLSDIKIYWQQAGRNPYSYEIQAAITEPDDFSNDVAMSDDTNWRTIKTISGVTQNTGSTPNVISFTIGEYVTAHYLRLVNKDADRKPMAISEFEVFGYGDEECYAANTPTASFAEIVDGQIKLNLSATNTNGDALTNFAVLYDGVYYDVTASEGVGYLTLPTQRDITVRVYAYNKCMQRSSGYAEVEVGDYVNPDDNLALNKDAYACKHYSDSEGEAKANDGSTSTYWTSYTSGAASNEWWYVDLGDFYNVNRIEVVWMNEYASANYSIQYRQKAPKNDSGATSSEWDAISEFTNVTTGDKSADLASAVGARYICLRSTSHGSTHTEQNRLAEVRVFGSAFGTPDEDAPVWTDANCAVTSHENHTITMTLEAVDAVDGAKYDFVINIDNGTTGKDYERSTTALSNAITITDASMIQPCVTYTITAKCKDHVGNEATKTFSDVTTSVSDDYNLALSKTTAAGISEGGDNGANAVDGNKENQWSGNATGKEDGVNQWMYVDLGQNYDIDSIMIMWGNQDGSWPQDYKIQVSYDGTNFRTIVHRKAKDASRTNSYADLGAKGQYVRVWADKSGTAYGMCITELEVYGGCYSEGETTYLFTGQNATSTAWSTAANWDIGEVPTSEKDVVLVAPAEVDVTNAAAKSVVIDQTGSRTGKLTIAANKALVVEGKVTKTTDDGETLSATEAADLKIESSSDGNGTLIFENDENEATVEMYSKASAATKPWSWQYIGVPFTSANAQESYYGSYMYAWPSDCSTWEPVTKSTTLTAFTGYLISHPTAGHTYVMDGELAATPEDSIKITVPAGSDMVVGNSWTAPIQITQMTSVDFVNVENTVNLFNAGMDSEEQHAADPVEGDRYAPGTYVTIPINSAPSVGVTKISSLQGFYVTNSSGSAGKLKLLYDKHVRPSGTNTPVNGQMHAPKRLNYPTELKIKVSGSRYDDRLILLEREDFSTGFDNGWDGKKLDEPGAQPMLYTTRPDGTTDAVSALPELDGTIIGFRAGEDNMYTLRFEYAEDNEELYIFDTQTHATTQVVSGNTYTFQTSDTDAHARFLLTRSNAPQITTDVGSAGSEGDAKAVKFLNNDKLFIYRNGVLYDATGKRVQTGEVRMDSGEKGGAQ